MLAVRSSLASVARPLRSAALAGVRRAASTTQPEVQTKRPDYLLTYENPSSVKEIYHYTSYFLAAGVPAALLLGAPVTTVLDAAMGVAIPLHFHIGMRAVLVDYVHEPGQQSTALAVLAGVTVLTALGLTKLNTTDVGITNAVTSLWVTQDPPAPSKAALKAANPF